MAMFLNTPLPYKRYKKISETTYFVDVIKNKDVDY